MNEKVLFVKITHHLDPEIRRKLSSCLGTWIPHSVLSMIYLQLKRKNSISEAYDVNFGTHKSETRMDRAILN